VKERQAHISPYNLALTFEVLSRAHSKQGNTGQAIEGIHEGLRRFPSGWQARSTSQNFRKLSKDRLAEGLC